MDEILWVVAVDAGNRAQWQHTELDHDAEGEVSGCILLACDRNGLPVSPQGCGRTNCRVAQRDT